MDGTPHRTVRSVSVVPSSLPVSEQGSVPTASSCVTPTLLLRHGVSSERRGATPALLSIPHARRAAYRTQDRRQILSRMLGVRNKSDTGGLVCAASSSSCMVDLKTFNDSNGTPVSRHSAVGSVGPWQRARWTPPLSVYGKYGQEDAGTGGGGGRGAP